MKRFSHLNRQPCGFLVFARNDNSMRRITAKSVHVTSVNNYGTRNHTPQLQAKNTLKFPSEIKASTFSEVSKVKARALLQSIAPTSNSTPSQSLNLTRSKEMCFIKFHIV